MDVLNYSSSSNKSDDFSDSSSDGGKKIRDNLRNASQQLSLHLEKNGFSAENPLSAASLGASVNTNGK